MLDRLHYCISLIQLGQYHSTITAVLKKSQIKESQDAHKHNCRRITGTGNNTISAITPATHSSATTANCQSRYSHYIRVRFELERTGTQFLFFFWSPERRSGPFRHIAAKFNKPIMNNFILRVYNVYTRFLLTILLQVSLKWEWQICSLRQ